MTLKPKKKIWQKKLVREKVLTDYWQEMDSILRRKNHAHMIVAVEDRYYEIVRRYKARR